MARPRKFDEAEVVRAARDQFWTHGYASTSLDDLSEVTGLGRGSLYGTFEDKHDLFLRALDDYASTVTPQLNCDLEASGESGYDRLVDHIHHITNVIAGDTKRRGCFMAKSAAELGSADKQVNRRVHKWLDGYHGQLTEAIRAAQAEGDLDAEADADAVGLVVLAVLRGAEALRKGGMPPRAIHAVGAQAIALLPRVPATA